MPSGWHTVTRHRTQQRKQKHGDADGDADFDSETRGSKRTSRRTGSKKDSVKHFADDGRNNAVHSQKSSTSMPSAPSPPPSGRGVDCSSDFSAQTGVANTTNAEFQDFVRLDEVLLREAAALKKEVEGVYSPHTAYASLTLITAISRVTRLNATFILQRETSALAPLPLGALSPFFPFERSSSLAPVWEAMVVDSRTTDEDSEAHGTTKKQQRRAKKLKIEDDEIIGALELAIPPILGRRGGKLIHLSSSAQQGTIGALLGLQLLLTLNAASILQSPRRRALLRSMFPQGSGQTRQSALNWCLVTATLGAAASMQHAESRFLSSAEKDVVRAAAQSLMLESLEHALAHVRPIEEALESLGPALLQSLQQTHGVIDGVASVPTPPLSSKLLDALLTAACEKRSDGSAFFTKEDDVVKRNDVEGSIVVALSGSQSSGEVARLVAQATFRALRRYVEKEESDTDESALRFFPSTVELLLEVLATTMMPRKHAVEPMVLAFLRQHSPIANMLRENGLSFKLPWSAKATQTLSLNVSKEVGCGLRSSAALKQRLVEQLPGSKRRLTNENALRIIKANVTQSDEERNERFHHCVLAVAAIALLLAPMYAALLSALPRMLIMMQR